jgi:hypothetical protein
MSLQLYIDQLLTQRVFSLTNGNLHCVGCNSTIARSNVRRHTRTKKHTSALSAPPLESPSYRDSEPPSSDSESPPSDSVDAEKECGICYNSKQSFSGCQTCRNEVCSECRLCITKCPFCRQLYQPPISFASTRKRILLYKKLLANVSRAERDGLLAALGCGLLVLAPHMSEPDRYKLFFYILDKLDEEYSFLLD